MKKIIIGIQGGKSSYNEVALHKHMKTFPIKDVHTRYLYSSKKVIEQLISGEIQYGQLAIKNSVGGYVEESTEAISDLLSRGYGVKTLEQYEISPTHCLMINQASSIENIEKVISHPQALSQCTENLNKHYGQLQQIKGEQEYCDQGKIAEAIAKGVLSENIATLGNPQIADTYGLKVVSNGLQDSNSSATQFLLLERVD